MGADGESTDTFKDSKGGVILTGDLSMDGQETIECDACGLRCTWEEYERSCTLLAREVQVA